MKNLCCWFRQEYPILFCLLILLLAVVGFVAAVIGIITFEDNRVYPYDFLQPEEQIVSIRLVDTGDKIGLYNNPLEEIPRLLEEAAVPVLELEPSSHAAFLTDFAAVPCHQFTNDPAPYIAKGTIVITYRDGSRERIARYGAVQRDAASDETIITWFYFDEEAFAALLHSYDYP